jgi:hypothetical protein
MRRWQSVAARKEKPGGAGQRRFEYARSTSREAHRKAQVYTIRAGNVFALKKGKLRVEMDAPADPPQLYADEATARRAVEREAQEWADEEGTQLRIFYVIISSNRIHARMVEFLEVEALKLSPDTSSDTGSSEGGVS